jgi:hypothetical protein
MEIPILLEQPETKESTPNSAGKKLSKNQAENSANQHCFWLRHFK